MTVSAANAQFWDELCGTSLARAIGIVDHTEESLARFDAAYFEMYPYLRPLIERTGVEGRRVLEIGLGFGTVGGYVARRARSYHAIDIAESPVALMQQRLGSAGIDADLAIRGTALALPYPDASLDTVISIGALHHTGDLRRSISEVHRVLVPDGRALIMVYNRHSFRRLTAVARLRLSSLRGRIRGSIDEQVRGLYDRRQDQQVAPHTDFVSPGQARRLLSAFRRVHVERRNFDPYVLGPFWFQRKWFIGNVDRLLGLDLYIIATK